MGDLPLFPISLTSSSSAITYDDAGNEVVKCASVPIASPPYASLPPYMQPSIGERVPPLVYFGIVAYVKLLSSSSRDSILQPPCSPRPYLVPEHDDRADLLQLLIPHMHPMSKAVMWKYVDPRLWITLIRMFWSETLPETFREYPMPLSDPYLPYIQYLEPTDHFALILVLDLSKEPSLTDESIIALKTLHQLTILNTSFTSITTKGVKKVADSLKWDENIEMARGPWKLRSWSMLGCRVKDDVAWPLQSFPLLAVVDLRETSCTRCPQLRGWTNIPAEEHTSLFYPTPFSQHLHLLIEFASQHDAQLLPSQNRPFSVYVNKLHYPAAARVNLEYNEHSTKNNVATRAFPVENGYFMLGDKGKTAQGSTVVEEKRSEITEAYERKKAAMESKGHFRNPDWDDPLQHLGDEPFPLRSRLHRSNFIFQTPSRNPQSSPKEALLNAQRAANADYEESRIRREREAAARLQRQRIDNSRDPRARSVEDMLKRSLMLVRVPPPYSALSDAIQDHKSITVQLAARRAEKRRAEQAAVIHERSAPIDKRKKVSDNQLWTELRKGSGQAGPSAPLNPPANRISRNPYASQPPPKKKVI